MADIEYPDENRKQGYEHHDQCQLDCGAMLFWGTIEMHGHPNHPLSPNRYADIWLPLVPHTLSIATTFYTPQHAPQSREGPFAMNTVKKNDVNGRTHIYLGARHVDKMDGDWQVYVDYQIVVRDVNSTQEA